MDGLMCSDIRLGVMVRTRMEDVERESYRVFYAIPANKGKTVFFGWQRKKDPGPPMAFSECLIAEAGGIDRLFLEWEFVGK